MKRWLNAVRNITLMCLLALPAWADRGEQKQVFGNYEVHYIGLTTSFLTPEVARAYGIERSGRMGMLNISVLNSADKSDVPQPVEAKVNGTLKNLIGQSKSLEFKEIKETNAVYYVATFRFDEEEVYRINLQVQPDGVSRSFDVKFSQRFYEE